MHGSVLMNSLEPKLQTGAAAAPVLTLQNVDKTFGTGRGAKPVHALSDFSLTVREGDFLSLLGPSGCGKSTALKCLNRMHDSTRGVRIEGRIEMHGHDIHSADIDPPVHRRKFGWVAQKPNPFTSTIWENVAYPARIHGLTRNRAELADHVERCLREAHLWHEVKDDLHTVAPPFRVVSSNGFASQGPSRLNRR